MSGNKTPSRSKAFWRSLCLGLMLALLCLSTARAEQEKVTKANYKQAFQYSTNNLKQFIYDTSVTPHWIGKTDSFWYSFRTSKGTRFYRVNPKSVSKETLFDRTKLSTQLSEMLQKPLDPTQLQLARMTMNEEGSKFKFVVEDFQYEYDLAAEKLAKLGKAPPAPPSFQGKPPANREEFLERWKQLEEQRQLEEQDKDKDKTAQPPTPPQGRGDYRAASPDKKSYVFARKHNLYLGEGGKDKESEAVQLTTDGVEDYSFGGGSDDRKSRPLVTWSSDSKMFCTLRNDSRGMKELHLVNSLAAPRPTVEKYKYAMPGEEAVRKTELYIADCTGKKVTHIPAKWKDESYSNLHWGKTCEELRFIRMDRLRRHIELCSLNTSTCEVKCLIPEGFENANMVFQAPRYLDETEEMIWWSERSGWGHFYLYDRNGKLKNAITSGNYRASEIVSVDVKNRLLFFRGNAREEGENVYFEHLYCIHLDGTGLTLMDPGGAYHRSTLSPSRQFVVDNCSATDKAPVSILRDASGKQILELEKADLSRLVEAGWKLPETFVVKAADGVTDLYGNMWKPFDFDPKKKYPIIAHVYPGPQQEGVTHIFSAISTNQQLAQLGFIVIQVGHRGGAPTRSKAYASYGYFNLRDYGLADKKTAIEQLATRYPFIDIERVGIYGHSGGAFMSTAALLQKPYNEFFKAAVASAGNHDNNIYNNSWAERYHGLKEVVVKKPEEEDDPQDEKKTDDKKTEDKKDVTKPETRFEIKVPTNAELAGNLKGALLLVHGDMDNNVHPANTMRLVDALIKANKRFDMLIIPGARHGFGTAQPYFQQRMWDFFADHLLGDRQTGADILEKRSAAPR